MARASQVVPGGVHSRRRGLDPPFLVRRAYGAYLEDVDGRRYIDYSAGGGTVILGHAYSTVDAKVAKAATRGILSGIGTNESEVELATTIVRHVPSVEQVLFCNSGSEATMHAIRLARAVTNRTMIIKMEGCYHGTHDYLLRNCQSERSDIGQRDPHSRGMLPAAVDATLVCRFNDLESVEEALARHPGEVAAIILEPAAHNGPGLLPKPGYLEGLRELANRHGCLLIFDEIVTGFRHGLGGYQAIAGVMPDLTTMGKAIANGYPFAAVGGRRDLMGNFNTRRGGDVMWNGTYNANGVGVAAALATIRILEDPAVYDRLFRLGESMRAGLRSLVAGLDIPVSVCGYGSLFTLCFMEGPVESYDDVVRNDSARFIAYRRELIARGVFEFPGLAGGMRSHITFSHCQADIDQTLKAAKAALATVAR